MQTQRDLFRHIFSLILDLELLFAAANVYVKKNCYDKIVINVLMHECYDANVMLHKCYDMIMDLSGVLALPQCARWEENEDEDGDDERTLASVDAAGDIN